jgi:hypothetical protein
MIKETKTEKMILRKMTDMESGGTQQTDIFPQETFYNDFTTYIRENSKLLKNAIICQGMPNSWAFYDIEPVSNTVTLLGSETLKTAVNVYKRNEFLPKNFGIEIILPNRAGDPDEEKENIIIENIIYKPLLNAIEKQCISGNYFHKSIFNTTNNITGNGFNGLLNLAREIKHTTDNGMIVINPVVIENILDSTMPSEYKQEFLFNQTIEGMPVIQTIEAPLSNAAAFDRKKIVFSLADNLSVKKFSVAGEINYYYHIFCMCNFSDLFSTSIVCQIN